MSLDGTTLAAFGKVPAGDTAAYSSPIEVDGAVVATLEATLPAGPPTARSCRCST